MSAKAMSMRDALYEPPGPKTRRRIRVVTAVSLLVLAALLGLLVKQFADNGQLNPRYWSFFLAPTTWKFIGEGLLGTLRAALSAGAIALVLSVVLMLGRISTVRALRAVSTAVIEFSRGVPSLLFIYFFFLVIPQYGMRLSSFWMIVLPVAIGAMGVVAEVLRAGVNAVPKGQVEAAMSLGMSRAKILRLIVLPQAVRFVIPSLIAQLVIVVKDTTFAYVVSYPDLMQNAKVLITNYEAILSVYLVTAVIYIVINFLINKVAVAISRRMHVNIISK